GCSREGPLDTILSSKIKNKETENHLVTQVLNSQIQVIDKS
ncbi:7139_t:CDS:1, partial [Cetraspora pellucida]